MNIYTYTYEESRKTKLFKFGEFIIKINVKRFGFNNLLQDFKFMKIAVKKAMDVSWNNRKKESVYKERFIIVHSAF